MEHLFLLRREAREIEMRQILLSCIKKVVYSTSKEAIENGCYWLFLVNTPVKKLNAKKKVKKAAYLPRVCAQHELSGCSPYDK